MRGYIRTGFDKGARLVSAGPEPGDGLPAGYYVRQTVFDDVTESMTTAREEIIGPMLLGLPHDGEEPIRLANATPYGLHGSIWSGELERAERVAQEVCTGGMDLNRGPSNILMLVGGMKQSGVRRECSVDGLDGFCDLRSLQPPMSRSVSAWRREVAMSLAERIGDI